jgi:hypothetical protein
MTYIPAYYRTAVVKELTTWAWTSIISGYLTESHIGFFYKIEKK